MNEDPLSLEKQHLAGLLEAIHRCVYFFDGLASGQNFPISGEVLRTKCKDRGLFDSLAALNERFAKLQDTCASAMRHAALLAGEKADTFLGVLSFYEKVGVVDSMESWQRIRMLRNMASHDYETSYDQIAEHFNALHGSVPRLIRTGVGLVDFCYWHLAVAPRENDFSTEYFQIAQRFQSDTKMS
ncbi:MAG: hypothetical protein WCO97_02300 [bacterium]